LSQKVVPEKTLISKKTKLTRHNQNNKSTRRMSKALKFVIDNPTLVTKSCTTILRVKRVLLGRVGKSETEA